MADITYTCNRGDVHVLRRPPPHPKGEHRHGCYAGCPEMSDAELIKMAGDCGVDGVDGCVCLDGPAGEDGI